MNTFNGMQYIAIDIANNFGKDKLLFEERIQWVKDNMDSLESLADQAETKPLYIKAVQAIRKAQQGLPTGHMVAMDGVCSGVQVMSVLTGCIAGARATGLVDKGVRADAYTQVTKEMNNILGGGLVVSRPDAKDSLMHSIYGSKKTPKDIFGEDTKELGAFYGAVQVVTPGSWELLQDLLASWQPYALMHSWKMPDGFDARIKVMQKVEARIEVDELDHATFTYEFYENQGSKKGLSNCANVIHSADAYILRAMHRRCNYDRDIAEQVAGLIEIELISRSLGMHRTVERPDGKAGYYVDQYVRSTLADVVIMPYLNADNVQQLSQEHLEKLAEIINGMLQYQPFPLVTVHDAFAAHPNNVNWVRWQYKEILADIADSDVLNDILSQLYGIPGTFNKLSFNLGDLVRESEYGLS